MDEGRLLTTVDELSPRGKVGEFEDHEERVADDDVPIGEHIFGFAMASLIRDYVHVWLGVNALHARYIRMALSCLMAFGCLGVQFFLLRAVNNLLCASAVAQIRNDYSNYELTVYGAKHSRTTENGFYRGRGAEFLNVTNFQALSDDDKHHICQIPLAHPGYTFAILLVWTMTCLADLRKTVDSMHGLLILTPTVKHLAGVLEEKDEGAVAVAGLTLPMKVLLSVFCYVPRLVSVSLLSFLGCRWLLATNSLNDILLNALALEFMLSLQYLVYEILVSKRGRHLTENTFVKTAKAGDLTVLSTVGMSLWLLAAIIWVYMYMYELQSVLLDYRWDVKRACDTWDGAMHF
eukprot:TRINITY_DN7194_c0_g1_i5.p1 TRINITY_DN7194_c0_g1~~TRINITY_DN7194_c0_g1_i5.p1  ORF type:complete len:348 (+),score=51.60 TRINITY_DN7194_c0_g1_i5:103-1146(+)